MGFRKMATTSYHPNGNAGTEQNNYGMAQRLSMVVNERHSDWKVELPYVEAAYNSAINAATGLSTNEVHLGRQPCLPLTVFEGANCGGHQSLDWEIITCCDTVIHCVGEYFKTVAKITKSYFALDSLLRKTLV